MKIIFVIISVIVVIFMCFLASKLYKKKPKLLLILLMIYFILMIGFVAIKGKPHILFNNNKIQSSSIESYNFNSFQLGNNINSL